jgi:hypothetical protein
MPDLEARLREAVADRSEAFVPSPDLPEKAVRRARQRERTRRLALVGAVASLVAVVAIAAGLALRPVDDGGDEFEMQPPASTTPPKDAGTAPRTSTSMTETTSSTAPTVPDEEGSTPSAEAIGPDTPLTMTGIGPIQVAMTLREVEEALGVRGVVDDYGTQGFECWRVTFPGIDGLRVDLGALSEDEDDPRNFTVSFVSGRPTPEGIDVGSPVADVTRVYGEPDQTLAVSSGGELLLYESADGLDGYAFLHDGSTVTEVRGGTNGLIFGSDEIC